MTFPLDSLGLEADLEMAGVASSCSSTAAGLVESELRMLDMDAILSEAARSDSERAVKDDFLGSCLAAALAAVARATAALVADDRDELMGGLEEEEEEEMGDFGDGIPD